MYLHVDTHSTNFKTKFHNFKTILPVCQNTISIPMFAKFFPNYGIANNVSPDKGTRLYPNVCIPHSDFS